MHRTWIGGLESSGHILQLLKLAVEVYVGLWSEAYRQAEATLMLPDQYSIHFLFDSSLLGLGSAFHLLQNVHSMRVSVLLHELTFFQLMRRS